MHYLGIFEKKEDAIRVRQEAEKYYFGSFLEQYYDENKDAAPAEALVQEPTGTD